MGYFQVRYDSRGVNYDRRGFIRLATGVLNVFNFNFFGSKSFHAVFVKLKIFCREIGHDW